MRSRPSLLEGGGIFSLFFFERRTEKFLSPFFPLVDRSLIPRNIFSFFLPTKFAPPPSFFLFSPSSRMKNSARFSLEPGLEKLPPPFFPFSAITDALYLSPSSPSLPFSPSDTTLRQKPAPVSFFLGDECSWGGSGLLYREVCWYPLLGSEKPISIFSVPFHFSFWNR